MLTITVKDESLITDKIKQLTVDDWSSVLKFLNDILENNSLLVLDEKKSPVVNKLRDMMKKNKEENEKIVQELKDENMKLSNSLQEMKTKLLNITSCEEFVSLINEQKKIINDNFSGKIALLEEKNAYQKQLLEKAQQDMTSLNEVHTQETKKIVHEITNVHDKMLTQVGDEITKFNELHMKKFYEYKSYSDERNETQTQYATELKKLLEIKSKEYEEMSKQLDDLKETLSSVYKFFNGSNQEKGDMGETIVKNFLTSNTMFVEAIVQDTSGFEASGDIKFTWKKLKTLIEVKNKKVITRDDIMKFVRDVEQSVDINSGIFISVGEAKTLPDRNQYPVQMEFVRNIPVFYIVGPPPFLIPVILALEKIISSADNKTQDNEKLVSTLRTFYDCVKGQIEFLDKLIVMTRKNLRQLEKRKVEIMSKFSPVETDTRIQMLLFNDEDSSENSDEEITIETKTQITNETKNKVDDTDQDKKPDLSGASLDIIYDRYIKFLNNLRCTDLSNKSFLETLSNRKEVNSILSKYNTKNFKDICNEKLLSELITADRQQKISSLLTEGKRLTMKLLTDEKILLPKNMRQLSRAFPDVLVSIKNKFSPKNCNDDEKSGDASIN